MAQIFQQVPLDHSRKETRFLRLFPAHCEDEIRTELFTASVEYDIPDFKALSYAWDLDGPKRYIAVNGNPIEVPGNVFVLLLKIRRHFCGTSAIILWIDSICINQEDIPEKNTQVPLMADIYTKASQVLVWLGDGNECTDQAIAVMNNVEIWKEGVVVPDPWEGDTMTSKRASFRNLPHLLDIVPIPIDSFLKGLNDIYDRGWFRRTWTLQEVALPQDDPLILCGDSTLSWKCLVISQRCLPQILLPAMTKLPQMRGIVTNANNYQELVLQTQPFKEEFETNFEKYEDIIDHSKSLETAIRTRSWHQDLPKFAREHRFGDVEPLSLHIHTTKQQLSTDPRDKIYGLLGLASDLVRRHIRVDYNKSAKDVFIDTFKFLVSHKRGFQILSRAAVPRLSEQPGWPTWLPRFDTYPEEDEAPQQFIWEYSDRCSVYQASLGLEPNFRLVDSDQVLILYGIPIDEVTQVTERDDPTNHPKGWKATRLDDPSTPEMSFLASKPCRFCIKCREGTYDACIERVYCPEIFELGQNSKLGKSVWASCTFTHDERGYSWYKWHELESEGPPVSSPGGRCRRINDWKYSFQEPMKEAVHQTFTGNYVAKNAQWVNGVLMFSRSQGVTTHHYRNPSVVVSSVGGVDNDGTFGNPWFDFFDDDFDGVPNYRKIRRYNSDLRHRSMFYVEAGRRVFRTSNGFIGFGPSTLDAGDKIVVIAGADVPFALRPDGDFFTLVGECYVEGLMQGELFKQQPEFTKGEGSFEIKLRQFSVR
ncbi:heterokaryon incompatibility protein-domain-containing protein [Hypoxylon fuscum]|nr:heterokaryon incompatibility protein-domain-containing protein [Hypoxylon fuscum]